MRIYVTNRPPRCTPYQVRADCIENGSKVIAIDLVCARQLQCRNIEQSHQLGLLRDSSNDELENPWQNDVRVVVARERALKLPANLDSAQPAFECRPEEVPLGPVITEESGLIHVGQLCNFSSSRPAKALAREQLDRCFENANFGHALLLIFLGDHSLLLGSDGAPQVGSDWLYVHGINLHRNTLHDEVES